MKSADVPFYRINCVVTFKSQISNSVKEIQVINTVLACFNVVLFNVVLNWVLVSNTWQKMSTFVLELMILHSAATLERTRHQLDSVLMSATRGH